MVPERNFRLARREVAARLRAVRDAEHERPGERGEAERDRPVGNGPEGIAISPDGNRADDTLEKPPRRDPLSDEAGLAGGAILASPAIYRRSQLTSTPRE